MVSGMLTAIRDFARDSFGGRAEDTLERFRVGELNCLIEHGPHAYLAVVVRGTPPHDLRLTLQRAIEAIHLQQTADLERFSGDASIFDDARPVLQECLESRFRGSDKPVSYRRWWIGAGVVAGAAGGVGRPALHGPAALQSLPGVARRATRPGRRQRRTAGRPLRRLGPARSAGGRSGVVCRRPRDLRPNRVEGRWALYQALDPRMAVPRAVAVLQPPPGVTLTMREDTLVATGEAPTSWVREASLLCADTSRRPPTRPLGHPERGAARGQPAAGSRDGAVCPRDARSGAGPGRGARRDGRRTACSSTPPRARRACAFASSSPGHTDADGPADRNLTLSRERAAAVVAAMPRAELTALEFESRGVGSAEPLSAGHTEADKQRNRRVAVRIHPLGASSQP